MRNQGKLILWVLAYTCVVPRKTKTGSPKNQAAVELAKLRAKKLSPERKREIGIKAGQARASKLSPERRAEIARKAGKAGAAARWGKKAAKKGQPEIAVAERCRRDPPDHLLPCSKRP